MKLPLYQIDAFASETFRGNPAAVVPLDAWTEDALLQAIAAENNLAETAFLLPRGDDYELRWFTPAVEIALCGHATLAAAFAVFESLRPGSDRVTFHTRSGPLTVTREGSLLSMDFPAVPAGPCAAPQELLSAFEALPLEILGARDYLLVYGSEQEVRAARPDLRLLENTGRLGVIITAPGSDCDFVSRFFAPAAGIPEDPVTGSAHCTLVPYWSARLGKKELHARQVSQRGGELFCRDRGDRVTLAGGAVRYLEGTIFIPDP